MYKKIEDRNDLIKDSSSKAVLNYDVNSLEQYKKKKLQTQEFINQKNSINSLEVRISNIENTLNKVIQLLEKNINNG